ncbi:NAD-dependent epimerase/dehydratase family protein [Deinococcus navajonensis]|uniref:NAD-dependent epimerase/dehydratase family protein n=1 Tax=Deinococcus navajonensis TaxID=309884 RepID=A0ABV8XMY2_9DEIO
MIIGVTGAAGMLGTHVRAYLKTCPEIEVILADRATFEQGRLPAFVKGCDAVLHLAGMNRGEDDVVARTNVALTEQLIGALEETGSRAHVLFSSSTHVDRDTPYGMSKRQAAALLEAWAQTSGGRFTNVILPGVFGEGGRPFYNSVVATFCVQIAMGEAPTVHGDALTEQIHAQEVARQLLTLIENNVTGTVRVQGENLTVTELRDLLSDMHDLYSGHVIPDLRHPFHRDLFNTYRSFLFPHRYPVPLTLHTDTRGSLFEAVKSHTGGQTFVSTTYPGVTRGNHFHTRKVERFLVSGGEAEIRIRHIFGTDVHTFRVSGEQPSYVDIPTLHTHNITNTGSATLLTMFWTNELFDPAAPDQVQEMVEPA